MSYKIISVKSVFLAIIYFHGRIYYQKFFCNNFAIVRTNILNKYNIHIRSNLLNYGGVRINDSDESKFLNFPGSIYPVEKVNDCFLKIIKKKKDEITDDQKAEYQLRDGLTDVIDIDESFIIYSNLRCIFLHPKPFKKNLTTNLCWPTLLTIWKTFSGASKLFVKTLIPMKIVYALLLKL